MSGKCAAAPCDAHLARHKQVLDGGRQKPRKREAEVEHKKRCLGGEGTLCPTEDGRDPKDAQKATAEEGGHGRQDRAPKTAERTRAHLHQPAKEVEGADRKQANGARPHSLGGLGGIEREDRGTQEEPADLMEYRED